MSDNVLTVNQDELIKHIARVGVSEDETRVLLQLLLHGEGYYNRVVNSSGSPMTFSELANILDMEEDALVATLGELDDKRYIRVLSADGLVEIFLNPFFYTVGEITYSQVSWYFNDYYNDLLEKVGMV